MTKQITNMIDAGIAYEHMIIIIEKLHRTIIVIITEKLWKQEATTTVVRVESQTDANQVQQLLCQKIGGKEISVKLSQI